jgi:tripartite-type tricarboxylate transporter receptor subunit TctC
MVAAALCVGLALSSSVSAAWPERAITQVHGFGVGGNADLTSRAVAERLEKRLGQPVVVEPRPGGGGRTAALSIVRAPADGYTLTMLPAGHAASAAMHEQLPYHSVNDFTFKVLGSLPYASTPEGFKERMAADIDRWTKLVKEVGIKRIGAQ